MWFHGFHKDIGLTQVIYMGTWGHTVFFLQSLKKKFSVLRFHLSRPNQIFIPLTYFPTHLQMYHLKCWNVWNPLCSSRILYFTHMLYAAGWLESHVRGHKMTPYRSLSLSLSCSIVKSHCHRCSTARNWYKSISLCVFSCTCVYGRERERSTLKQTPHNRALHSLILISSGTSWNSP